MSKVTVEEINGEKMTVVWHYGKSDISDLLPMPLNNGVIALTVGHYDVKLEDMFFATALPALPKDISIVRRGDDKEFLQRLASLYRGAGLRLFASSQYSQEECDVTCNLIEYGFVSLTKENKITHATMNGERVEIAIRDDDDDE